MKRKKLKSILACMLVLSMVFGVQSAAFAAETDDTVVQKEGTDDTTDTTDITDKADDTEDKDTTGKNDVDADTEGETIEPNSGIAPASAEDDIVPLSDDTKSGYCGAEGNEEAVMWKLEQSNEDNDNPTYTLTISGSGAMADYDSSSAVPWYSNFNSISTVVIDEGITHIGKWIVKDSTSLKNIQISSTVQSISEKAFHYTTSKNEVTSITVANGNNYISVTNGTLFSTEGTGQKNLVLYVGNETTYEIPADVATIYAGAFAGNSTLQTIIFANGSQIKVIGENAFRECSSLSTFVFPSGLETIKSNAFMKTALTEVTIPDSVTSLENAAFSNCSSLASISIGGGLTTLSKQVFQNAAITEIILPTNISIIGEQSFSGCSKLNSVTFEGNPTSFGSKAFFNCTSLKNMTLPESVSTIAGNVFEGCTMLETLIIKGAITSVSDRLCYSCTNLKAFIANGNISSIGRSAFEGCSSLDAVVILGASGTITLGTSAFNNASSLRIEYVSNTGIRTSTSTSCVAVTNGGVFTDDTHFISTALAAPTKANHKFLGWYDNESCTGTPVTEVEAGKTYYAGWQAKEVSIISFIDNAVFNKAYNGSEYIVSTNNYEVTGSTGTVTFVYQEKDENDEWKDLISAPVNVGDYRVKATVAEDDNYASAETGWKEFSIQKATPAYTVPTGLTAVEGQTLADIALPEGFTWQDAGNTSVGSVGEHIFHVIYTPYGDDKDNYNIVNNIEVTLTVKKKDVQKPAEDGNEKPGDSGNSSDKKPTDTDKKAVSASPRTGDNAKLWLWIMFVVLSGGLAMSAEMKRKR